MEPAMEVYNRKLKDLHMKYTLMDLLSLDDKGLKSHNSYLHNVMSLRGKKRVQNGKCLKPASV